MRAQQKSTINPNSEIEKFNALATAWWDPAGPMAPLHWMNPARLSFIKQHMPKGARMGLDIGCGAGLLTEPLARMGYDITGVDGASDAIAVANQRAQQEGLNINYSVGEVPHVPLQSGTFDFVTALEIVEHVKDVPCFIRTALSCLKPGGRLFLSTLNRTLKSRLIAIIGAEYILRALPLGTHDHSKFIKPSELVETLQSANAETLAINGLVFNPLQKTFRRDETDLSINYILVAEKRR